MRFRVFVTAGVVLAAAQQVAAQQPVAPPVPQIATTGRGEVQAAPDRASIFFAVETRAVTAAAAGAENARRQKAVLDTLRRLGLADDMLKTTGYSVTPEHSYEPNRSPRVIGYTARNTIKADVHRLDLLGRYIDGALGAGSNNISSLTFSASREDEFRREALAAAVTKARADAEAMARAAGGSLGGLLELSAGYEFPRPMPMDMRAARASAQDVETPIVPGDQTIAATVNARWAFVGPR